MKKLRYLIFFLSFLLVCGCSSNKSHGSTYKVKLYPNYEIFNDVGYTSSNDDGQVNVIENEGELEIVGQKAGNVTFKIYLLDLDGNVLGYTIYQLYVDEDLNVNVSVDPSNYDAYKKNISKEGMKIVSKKNDKKKKITCYGEMDGIGIKTVVVLYASGNNVKDVAIQRIYEGDNDDLFMPNKSYNDETYSLSENDSLNAYNLGGTLVLNEFKDVNSLSVEEKMSYDKIRFGLAIVERNK